MSEKSIEELIKEETENRIKMMSDKDYVFPERINRKDYIAIILLIVICLVLIVLCMTGVIQ